MALEIRNGNVYYYTKQRKPDGKVVSTYAGCAEIARLQAQLDAHKRRECEEQRQIRNDQALVEQREAQYWAAIEQVRREIATIALLSTGYHQHKRTWRKRRTVNALDYISALNQRTEAEAKERERLRRLKDSYAALPALPAPDDHSPEARKTILARANHAFASKDDLVALRRLATTDPAMVAHVDMLAQALRQYADQCTASPAGRTLLPEWIARQREAFGYEQCGPLERGLIDAALLAQLRYGEVEAQWTVLAATGPNERTTRLWEHRLTQAQQRYHRAIDALQKYRRVTLARVRIDTAGNLQADVIEAQR